ncbi:malate dehydrogenase, mitochondrial-like [Drosophila guanche]|uniref:Malate dehydrogenase n=1 Tax=Drosophila guanche TaxID=7266 RepID=A0A3B0JDE2_DROGU|nr:malate dehydrogenase, mitochondrial-like [Drosophila guanche]SPP73250.1 blast:Malate dehydrogenase%2C mitochondrial [Drosophila guanche]
MLVCRSKGLLQRLLSAGPGSTTSSRDYKVAVVGASGAIGQPLSLLLKQNSLVSQLSIHDMRNIKGVEADLSHICTSVQTNAYEDQQLEDCLAGADVVVVPAGLPRKPGMTRDQLFEANAGVALRVACSVSESCPGALLAFVTNPINSIVPIAAELLKAKNSYDPRRLFGITTLDVVRARTFVGDFLNVNPAKVNLPVIGGHAGKTILPIFSQCCPSFQCQLEDIRRLTHRIQEAGTEVVNAKDGAGSATLSMAYAAARFVNSLLRGLSGEPDVMECAYVGYKSPCLPFFATPLMLSAKGIEQNLGLPHLDDFERQSLEQMLPELEQSIQKGIVYAKEKMEKEECQKECQK